MSTIIPVAALVAVLAFVILGAADIADASHLTNVGSITNSFSGLGELIHNGTHLFVADSFNNKIQVFDKGGNHVADFGTSSAGNITYPVGLAFNTTHIFASSFDAHKIFVYHMNGTHAITFDTGNRPSGVDYNGTHILVSEYGANRITIFNKDFSTAGTINRLSIPASLPLTNPTSTVHNDTHMFVTYSRNEILIFDKDGDHVGKFGSAGSGDGRFNTVGTITFNSKHLFVADRDNHRIQMFHQDGRYLHQFGEVGSGIGKLIRPHSVTFNTTHIFVSDDGNSRIQIFALPILPDKPTGLTATPGNAQVSLSWNKPNDDLISPITDYKVEYRAGGGAWTTFVDGESDSTTAVVTSLASGVQHTFRISAINAEGTGMPSDTATATPRTITFTSDSTRSVDELVPITYTFTAIDGTGTITYTLASTNATGTVPTISSNGTLNWEPSEEQGGKIFAITATATDTSNNVERHTLLVTVNEVNVDPILDVIPNQNAEPGETITITLNANDMDIPKNTLTYSRNGTSGTLNANTGVFSWTLISSNIGVHNIEFTVDDNEGGTDTQIVRFTIQDNTAPTFTSASAIRVDEESASSHTFTATDAGGSITFDITGHNATGTGVHVPNISSGGVLTWTPSEIDGGSGKIVVINATATDPANNVARQTLLVTVDEVNSDPVLSTPSAQSIVAGQLLQINLSADDTDVPANILSYSKNGTIGTLNTGTGVFTWTPTSTDTGISHIDFTVSDGVGGTDSQLVRITVLTAPNNSPTIASIPDQSVDEHQEITFTASASDDDNDQLTYSLVGNIPLNAAINSTTGVFRWTPNESQDGTHTFSVSASDGKDSVLESVTITVNEVNVPPVLDVIPSQNVEVGNLVSITLSAADSDVPANPLTYSRNGTLGFITGTAFSWTITPSDLGVHHILFTVSDGSGGTDTQIVRFTIQDNTAPTFTSASAIRVDEESASSHTFTATDAGGSITFDITGHNATGTGVHVPNISSGGVLTWTPSEIDGGSGKIVVINATATDPANNVARQTLLVTVDEVNTPPKMDAIPDRKAIPDVVITIDLSVVDSDIPANDLVYGHNHTSGSLTGNQLTWTPTSSDLGVHHIMFTVSDGDDEDSEILRIVVSNTTNNKPDGLTITRGISWAYLEWSEPTDGAPITDYIIEYSSANVPWRVFTDDTSTKTSANVTGLAEGTLYTFRVSAENMFGRGNSSDPVSALLPRSDDPVRPRSSDDPVRPRSSNSGGGGGGGSADKTPPSIITNFRAGEYPLVYDGIRYAASDVDSVHQASIPLGGEFHSTVSVYDDRGADLVRQAQIFVDHKGSRVLFNGDETSIKYDNGRISIVDPDNIISNATITRTTATDKAIFEFVIVFGDHVKRSDVLYRIWDARNMMHLHLKGALETVDGTAPSVQTDIQSQPAVPESKLHPDANTGEDNDTSQETLLQTIRQWGGYDADSVTDSELLEAFGIRDGLIPPYFRDTAKWFVHGPLSVDEFANALKYFEANDMLG